MSYKKCPACGGQLLINVRFCGGCGYKFPTTAVNVVAIPQQQQECSNCGNIDPASAVACQRCGHYYISQQPAMPRLSDPGWKLPSEGTSTNYAGIVGMWLFTASAGGVLMLFGIWAALCLDAVAVLFAISLVSSDSAANRANGWIKLGLEGIAFVVAIAVSANVHRY